MSVMIQLRHVPDALHARLKSRAAASGQSLSDYLIGEVREIAEKPTLAEMLARIRALPPVEAGEDPVAIIRAMRDA